VTDKLGTAKRDSVKIPEHLKQTFCRSSALNKPADPKASVWEKTSAEYSAEAARLQEELDELKEDRKKAPKSAAAGRKAPSPPPPISFQRTER